MASAAAGAAPQSGVAGVASAGGSLVAAFHDQLQQGSRALAAAAEPPPNVAEARRWIADWRTKQAGGGGGVLGWWRRQQEQQRELRARLAALGLAAVLVSKSQPPGRTPRTAAAQRCSSLLHARPNSAHNPHNARRRTACLTPSHTRRHL
jgi:hypothetical protein